MSDLLQQEKDLIFVFKPEYYLSLGKCLTTAKPSVITGVGAEN